MTYDAHSEIIPADPKALHTAVVAAGAEGWELKAVLPIMQAAATMQNGLLVRPTQGTPALVLVFQRPAGYQVEETAEELSGV